MECADFIHFRYIFSVNIYIPIVFTRTPGLLIMLSGKLSELTQNGEENRSAFYAGATNET